MGDGKTCSWVYVEFICRKWLLTGVSISDVFDSVLCHCDLWSGIKAGKMNNTALWLDDTRELEQWAAVQQN